MADTYLIPIKQTIKTAWGKVYGTKKIFWTAFLVAAAITIVCGLINALFKTFLPQAVPLIGFITQLIAFLLQMGLTYIGIKRAFDQPIHYKLVFKCFEPRVALYIILVYLLQLLILLLPIALIFGAMLLPRGFNIVVSILAGILIFYLFIRFMLAFAIVLDQNKNPWEAIKQSFHLTQHNFWHLFAILILQNIIVIISIIPAFIGLIWTIPFCVILYGTIYRNLLINKNPPAVSVTAL